MKLRNRYLILFASLVILAPMRSGVSCVQSVTKITESDLEAMMVTMERAEKKGNVAGMIAFFAPDIKINMSVLNPGRTKEEEWTLTKEEFVANARRNLRRKLSYQSERKNTRIKIYDDQTAMITCDVYETVKMRDGTFRAASSEVVYVVLRDGKLVITTIDVRMRVY